MSDALAASLLIIGLLAAIALCLLRRVRFSVRELFLLMAIGALVVGWWLDHRRADLAVRYAQAKEKVAEFDAQRWSAAVDKLDKTNNQPANLGNAAISDGSMGK
ncbi:MAG TPA: hypothetical protein VMJ32_04370 [Pirellulales bacterium]|nr:hypothetical protein [Pirellulales bacterium]